MMSDFPPRETDRSSPTMSDFQPVANLSELPVGASLCVEFEGEPVALFNVDGEVFAIADTCTHADAPLSEGTVDGHRVECPWHAAFFDLRTGEALDLPAEEPVARYEVEVVGEEIRLKRPS